MAVHTTLEAEGSCELPGEHRGARGLRGAAWLCLAGQGAGARRTAPREQRQWRDPGETPVLVRKRGSRAPLCSAPGLWEGGRGEARGALVTGMAAVAPVPSGQCPRAFLFAGERAKSCSAHQAPPLCRLLFYKRFIYLKGRVTRKRERTGIFPLLGRSPNGFNSQAELG